MDGDYSWCLTRVRDDNTMVEDSEYWGQCNKRCEGIYVWKNHWIERIVLGQKLEPSNQWNQIRNEKLWRDDVYDLKYWYDGLCHTFLPKEHQPKGRGYFTSFYLGHRNSNISVPTDFRLVNITKISVSDILI